MSTQNIRSGILIEQFLDMLLHYHFYINPTNYHPEKFRKKSNWQPLNQNQVSIQNFLSVIKKGILATMPTPRENLRNLSQEGQTALPSLKNIKVFLIKPADKGGKIVLSCQLNPL